MRSLYGAVQETRPSGSASPTRSGEGQRWGIGQTHRYEENPSPETMGTTEATLRMDNMEVKDEWQDEDFPRPLPEEGDMESSCGLMDSRTCDCTHFPERGRRGGPGGGPANRKRRTLVAPEMNLSLDQSDGSLLSDEFLDTPDDLDINVDDIETPDETDSLEFISNGNDLEWEDDTPVASAKVAPSDGAGQGDEAGRLWRTVIIGEQENRIDMQIIRPYLRVVTHGGYYGEGLNAIIVFAACHLPDSGCAEYHYIMENLFLLRKNLKAMIIAHPSWFIRTVLAISRPFISEKFMNKIRYVHSLEELADIVPMEHVQVPDCVVQAGGGGVFSPTHGSDKGAFEGGPVTPTQTWTLCAQTALPVERRSFSRECIRGEDRRLNRLDVDTTEASWTRSRGRTRPSGKTQRAGGATSQCRGDRVKGSG
ncbi:hypothetical protein AAFF_G00275620 [Aldrovandia affinis]|uniref:CRAL-TRIO domain-containing protein n=1 Tax=Aldrovandia affinis TaxID=143900 RepID=A0AAD7RB47_9TELE|nr:hypothetical protein AAFF_G00275620 [Aldrovandia affinis]